MSPNASARMIQTAALSRTVSLHPRTASVKTAAESGDFVGAFAQAGSGAERETLPGAAEDDTRQDAAATGNALPPPQIAFDPTFVWQPIVAVPPPVPSSPIAESVDDAVSGMSSVKPLLSAKPPRSAIAAAPIESMATGDAPSGPPALPSPSLANPSLANPSQPSPSLAGSSLPQAAAPPPVSPRATALLDPLQAEDAPMLRVAAAIMATIPPATAGAQVAVAVAVDTVATDASRWAMPATPVALGVIQPDIVQPQPGTVASAARVFGAAIQAASRKREEPDTPAAPSESALIPIGTTATHEIKAADAQQAPLDMRQDRWPHAMIERIEMLRDAADAVDTRIRLVPDALGAIDVSVKTDGDTVRVQFTAEQAATRTLLADAQPRLAELAEARGLKLAQGSLGDSGAHQQRSPTSPQTPNRPAPVSTVIADTPDDIRIA